MAWKKMRSGHRKTMKEQEAIEQVVLANRILSHEGIFDYLGHVSVRNPANRDSFFISRALAPDQVTKADILEVALDGKVDDRLRVGIGLEDLRSLGVVRHTSTDPIDAGADVVERDVHVGAPAERQAYLASSLVRARGNSLHT